MSFLFLLTRSMVFNHLKKSSTSLRNACNTKGCAISGGFHPHRRGRARPKSGLLSNSSKLLSNLSPFKSGNHFCHDSMLLLHGFCSRSSKNIKSIITTEFPYFGRTTTSNKIRTKNPPIVSGHLAGHLAHPLGFV